MSTILVTGAAGFIGSHVCEALVSRGARVVGIDNFDPFYDVARKRENVRTVMERARGEGAAGGRHDFGGGTAKVVAHRDTTVAQGAFEMVECDICDAGAVRAVFEKARPEGVVHLAAKAGVRPSIADPVGYARANVTGTAVMLEEARGAGCSRIVVASSFQHIGILSLEFHVDKLSRPLL